MLAPAHAGADAGSAAAPRDGDDAGARRGPRAPARLRPAPCCSTRRSIRRATSRPRCCRSVCALARQCFINEYVFHLPDVEHDGMVALRGKLMADLSGTTPVLRHHVDRLCVLRAAAPRSTARPRSCRREWPQPVHGVIDQQVASRSKRRAIGPRCRASPHHRRDVGARAPAIRGEPLSALGAGRADAARARHRGLSCVPCFRSRR